MFFSVSLLFYCTLYAGPSGDLKWKLILRCIAISFRCEAFLQCDQVWNVKSVQSIVDIYTVVSFRINCNLFLVCAYWKDNWFNGGDMFLYCFFMTWFQCTTLFSSNIWMICVLAHNSLRILYFPLCQIRLRCVQVALLERSSQIWQISFNICSYWIYSTFLHSCLTSVPRMHCVAFHGHGL